MAIGSSTGGPSALSTLLRSLPTGFPVPVLVAQHMTPGFTSGLVNWLQAASALPLKVADDGERARPGTVYFAPDDRHLLLEARMVLSISCAPPVHAVRPSVSVLFESVARTCGSEAIGVLLTGMGKDGADGLRVIREAGGFGIVQDKESSAVWGMPGAAVALGAYDLMLPLGDIGRTLVRILVQ